jgi:hypothetical protein
VATLAYVGAKGTHLTLTHELNAFFARDTGIAENPFQPGQPTYGRIFATRKTDSVLTPIFKVNGQKITGQPAINLNIACGNDPNPFRPLLQRWTTLQRVEPEANSNYNALQFSLRKTDGPLTLDVAYTYSHSLDDSSDNLDGNFVNSYDIHSNYSSSNYDQRHILTASWVYEEPFRRQRDSRTRSSADGSLPAS